MKRIGNIIKKGFEDDPEIRRGSKKTRLKPYRRENRTNGKFDIRHVYN